MKLNFEQKAVTSKINNNKKAKTTTKSGEKRF